MSANSSSSSWDFQPVLSLLHTFLNSPPTKSNDIDLIPPPAKQDRQYLTDKLGPRLGNFDVVLNYLSHPLDIPQTSALNSSSDDSSCPSSFSGTCSTAASSLPEDDVEHFDNFIRAKEVRFSDEVSYQTSDRPIIRKENHEVGLDWKSFDVNELRRLIESNDSATEKDYSVKTRGTLSEKHKGPNRSRSLGQKSRHGDGLDSETDSGSLPQYSKQEKAIVASSKADSFLLTSAFKLTPAWVTPPPQEQTSSIPPDVPYIQLDRRTIVPLFTLTKEEKKAKLVQKILKKFGAEPTSTLATDPVLAASQIGGNTEAQGVHVFVDGSNIVIGFQDCLKKARGMARHTFTNRPPFSYHSLALILERGRSVSRRVLLGSADRNGLPKYMREAAQCGYEVSALERVEKVRDMSVPRRRGGSGYVTSGQSSGSEAPVNAVKTNGEQGVDEILQMKMLESLVDYAKPSTIVLATGDAAEAEYSGGFLKNVERALEKGWKVELVAWRDNIAFAWRAKDFVKKWKGRFTIIELDIFSEELLAEYVIPSFYG